MKENLSHDRVKLSELITSCPDLILMLPRFGIPFGFGDRTVADVCAEHGVDVKFFMLVCNVHSSEGFVPARDAVEHTDMTMLVPYLKASHNYYLTRLNHIREHLVRIVALMPERVGDVLMKFFDKFMHGVRCHFEHEEADVFPMIERAKSVDSTVMTAHDSSLEDTLDDLIQILFKYIPEKESSNDTIGVVFDILELSKDLRRHTVIEDKVLLPYLQYIEREE